MLTEAHDSVATQLVRDFEGYGIELVLRPCALREVARRAAAEQTGARGLLTVLEGTLRSFKFELPSTAITRLEVDAQTICQPTEELRRLLGDDNDESSQSHAAPQSESRLKP